MKIFTYRSMLQEDRLAILINDRIVDVRSHALDYEIDLPDNMLEFLKGGDKMMERMRNLESILLEKKHDYIKIYTQIISPVPNPPSCRDAYAFRQHVEAARRNRGLGMIEEFDQYPIFYFTNHNALYGNGPIYVENDHLNKLDFELEWAVIIGKKGRNIPSSEADSYIAGFTIMNDWSARTLQMEEMMLNLGPAKGKDFATSLGPWLVTPDELIDKRIETPFGYKYDLTMKAYHNNKLVSLGNTKDMNWTFAEIIERASYGVDLFPGDVIGSGTVGTGCYLELNGTWAREAKDNGRLFTPVWIESGDTMVLEIERLGKLTNTIYRTENNVSILNKKKLVK